MTQTNAYSYGAAWVILGIIGVVFQLKQKEKFDGQKR
jgi:hypothetical protein